MALAVAKIYGPAQQIGSGVVVNPKGAIVTILTVLHVVQHETQPAHHVTVDLNAGIACTTPATPQHPRPGSGGGNHRCFLHGIRFPARVVARLPHAEAAGWSCIDASRPLESALI